MVKSQWFEGFKVAEKDYRDSIDIMDSVGYIGHRGKRALIELKLAEPMYCWNKSIQFGEGFFAYVELVEQRISEELKCTWDSRLLYCSML